MNSQGDAVYAGVCRVDKATKDSEDQGRAQVPKHASLSFLPPFQFPSVTPAGNQWMRESLDAGH